VNRREVEHRSRHHADIDHIRAGRGDACNEGVAQQGAGQPTVAADADRRQFPVGRLGAKRCSDEAHGIRRQGRVDDAADVIGLGRGRGRLGGQSFEVCCSEVRGLKSALSSWQRRRRDVEHPRQGLTEIPMRKGSKRASILLELADEAVHFTCAHKLRIHSNFQ